MRVLVTLVFLLGCFLPAAAQPTLPAAEPTLAHGDVVQIVVFGYNPFGGEFEILDDGTINGRGFGRLKASGLTIAGLETRVSAALRGTLKDPSVKVILRAKRRQLAYILTLGAQPEGGIGTAFRQAGAIPIMPGMTLRQMLAGVTLPGEPDLLDATLNRKNGTRIDIDLLRLMRGEAQQWNGLIEPDDTLTILPKPYVRVWLIGQIKAPGEVRVREGTDIYQAVAENGGFDNSEALVDELVLTLRRGPDVQVLPARSQGTRGPILMSGDVVTVEPPKRMRLVVGGEIAAPGEYLLPVGSRLGRLIAAARGVTAEGTLAQVLIMRGSELFKVDATGPISGNVDADFALAAGDYVYVMRNERAVYATGEVNLGGRHLIPDGTEWTAVDLLSQAKGLSSAGTLRRVVLLRPDATGRIVATRFNLDEFLKDGRVESNPKLLPGDVLYFGQPKGLSTSAFPLIGQAAFYLDAIFKGR